MLRRVPLSTAISGALVAAGGLLALSSLSRESTLFTHVQTESVQVADAIGKLLASLGLHATATAIDVLSKISFNLALLTSVAFAAAASKVCAAVTRGLYAAGHVDRKLFGVFTLGPRARCTYPGSYVVDAGDALKRGERHWHAFHLRQATSKLFVGVSSLLLLLLLLLLLAVGFGFFAVIGVGASQCSALGGMNITNEVTEALGP